MNLSLVRGLVFPTLLLLGGCDLPTAPVGLPEDQLLFLRATADAPPLETGMVTFWARRGEDAFAQIRYVATGNYSDRKCMEFRIPAASLQRYPDGRSFAAGDSVRITIRVVDPDRFIFEFLPSGLRFSSGAPAQLSISYRWADRDFDGNGVIDARDGRYANSFGIWRQERDAARWTRLLDLRDAGLEEVYVPVSGFSKYAMATNRE